MTAREYFMIKLAEKQERSRLEAAGHRISKFVHNLGESGIKKKELRQIEGQLQQVKPKTEKEKKIERLTGRKWTPGQYMRGAGIGALVGGAGHAAGALIEGAGKGTVRELMAPRKMLRSAAIASLYGAALPAARRIADVEAAKRGKF